MTDVSNKSNFGLSFFIFSHTNMPRSGQRQRFPCRQCEHTFSTRYKARFHEKNIHAETIRTTVCLHCGRRFSTRTNLMYHQRFSHNMASRPYKCVTCGQAFRYPREVEHYRIHVDQHVNRFYKKYNKNINQY